MEFINTVQTTLTSSKIAHKILLPVVGMWYHALYSMFQNYVPNILESITQELSKVMCLCADAVQLVTSANIKVMGDCHESVMSLQSKLQKAQTNTKNLTDVVTTDGKGHIITHQMIPKKWLSVMSENSLRIQEAARLSSLNCQYSYKVKRLGELQEDVKTLTDSYLQAAEEVGTMS